MDCIREDSHQGKEHAAYHTVAARVIGVDPK